MRFFLLIALLPSFLRAEDPGLKGPGLEISLIAENATITPGQAFLAGVHLQHFPGFHTYWQSPGMVGMETSLEWKLPKGFKASEIQWPYPENTFMGQYPCHGYERDVTLLVTITPPKKITGKSVTLTTEASWMCCAKGCFPGFQPLTLTLPVSDKPVPDPKNAALIAKAQNELPATGHNVTATLLSKPGAPVIEILFKRKEGFPRKGLYFFSTDGQISSDQTQKFLPQPNQALLLKIPRSEFSPENKTKVPGVLKIGKKSLAITAIPPEQ